MTISSSLRHLKITPYSLVKSENMLKVKMSLLLISSANSIQEKTKTTILTQTKSHQLTRSTHCVSARQRLKKQKRNQSRNQSFVFRTPKVILKMKKKNGRIFILSESRHSKKRLEFNTNKTALFPMIYCLYSLIYFYFYLSTTILSKSKKEI